MEKQFVTYEIALKLKKLGFDEPCIGLFTLDGKFHNNYEDGWLRHNSQGYNNCSAPLWQQVIDWFMENNNLFISTVPFADIYASFHIHKTNEIIEAKYLYGRDVNEPGKNKHFTSVYEARKEAIEKAIELIKNNNKNKSV